VGKELDWAILGDGGIAAYPFWILIFSVWVQPLFRLFSFNIKILEFQKTGMPFFTPALAISSI
jgi:hypothetical protein